MSSSSRDPIAIVGIGCRFPRADGPTAFWRLLHDGVDAIGPVPPDRFDAEGLYDPSPATPGKVNTRWGGFLDGIDRFDADFFGVSPREAERLDPQQRLLLETSWEALEDGGIVPDSLAGTQTGVFVGMWINEYEARLFRDPRSIDFYMTIGSGRYSASGRLSYVLGLQGPSLTVDTGCSASLVAVHLACQSLWSGETGVALAGGVNAILEPNITIAYSQSGMMAPDGRCKFGDARADGYVRSEGAGVVVLKPLARALADGDRVYATILGSAVNNDGRSSGFLTTPGSAGQEEMLRLAYRHAGVSPGRTVYVEAHGTGTRAGDPVEVHALGTVLAEGRAPDSRCRLGSVKTNIGHTEGAAGVAGLIKVALALRHGLLPPSLHLEEPNPQIPWATLPVVVQRTLEAWPAGPEPAVAGVSSFGIAGTNAHVVLQQAPALAPDVTRASVAQPPRILTVSARSEAALAASLARVRALFSDDHGEAPSLDDLCWTASVRRAHHDHRVAIVARGRDELVPRLGAAAGGESVPGVLRGRSRRDRAPRIVFVFPGQGSQWAGMGRQLLAREPHFRSALERCDRAVLAEAGWSVIEQLLAEGSASRMSEIDVIQPVLFSIEVALAAVWRAWGFEPSAVVGHSMGEVAACHVAGALSIEDAVRIICRRSRLLRRTSGKGAMAVIELTMAEAQEALAGRERLLSVAVSNSSRSTVVSGDPAALEGLLAELEPRDVFCRRVKVDVASHSPQMDALQPDLLEALSGVGGRAAAVPIYSTVSGHVIDGSDLDASYWVRNLRAPVLFAGAVQRLVLEGHDTFIEMSPHPILLPAIEEGLRDSGVEALTAVASLRRDEDEQHALMTAVATLYTAGHPVAWDRLYARAGRHVDLPTYPWQRERYWFDAVSQIDLVERRPSAAGNSGSRHPLLNTAVDLADEPGARIWELQLDTWSPRYVQDLLVRGLPIVPASVWLDLLFSLGQELGGGGPLTLRDVAFRRPELLPQPGASTSVQLKARPCGAGWSCGIHTRTPDGWRQVVAAQLQLGAEGRGDPRSIPDVTGLGNRADGLAAYERLQQTGAVIGASLRAIDGLWRSTDRSVARLEVPSNTSHERRLHPLHPSLIEGALQLAVLEAGVSDGTHGVAYPRSIATALLTHTAEGGTWAEMIHSAQTHLGGADVRLVDESGAEILALAGLQLGPVQADALAGGGVNDWLYALEWVPQPAVSIQPGGAADRTWVITADDSGLARALGAELRASGREVLEIDVADAPRAIAQAAAERPGSVVVLYVAADARTLPPASSVRARAAVDIAATVSRLAPSSRPRLWMVTQGAQPVGSPHRVACDQAAVWGVGRTVAEEHPEVWGGLIDVDPESSAAEGAAAVLSALEDGGREDQIAFRDGARYVLRLVPASLSAASRPGPGLRPDATYVIAGGLGKLGLKVAHWMVQSGARRLVLLSRTPLPPRSAWSDIGSGEDGRIAGVRQLEALGATVLAAAVDVADIEQLRAALAPIQSGAWPSIAGVVQCAGVADGRLLGDCDEASFDKVWGPKAQGTFNLQAVTSGLPLDFFVLFSSMASFLPSPGQASYAAANAYLDALAADAGATGRRTLAINWGPWAEVGMAAELARRGGLNVTSRGFRDLESDQALSALARLLAGADVPQLAVMAFDWRAWRGDGESSPLFAALAAAAATAPEADGRVAPALDIRQQLEAATTLLERRSILEGFLQEQIGQVLRRPAGGIELTKPLRGMGLDSLMALELRSRLERLTGTRLPATLAWNYPTVTAIAPFLGSRLGFELTESPTPAFAGGRDQVAVSAADVQDVEQLLAELEQMSDADARRLTGRPQ